MSTKSDDEPSPKRQKASGDEAEAEEAPREKSAEKKDDAEVEANGSSVAAAPSSEGAEVRKRGRETRGDADALVSKLMERPIAKKADVRGRRLLGAMMGHLVQAKSRLKAEGLLDPKKRIMAEVKADRAAQEKEMGYLERRLEKHYTAMKNFIRTRAEPTIFYLPKKHTPKTQSCLEETRSAIEQKINALKVHLRSTTFGEDVEEEKKEKEEKKEDEKGKDKEADKSEAKNGKSEGAKGSGSESEGEGGEAKARAAAAKKALEAEEEEKDDKDEKDEKGEKDDKESNKSRSASRSASKSKSK